MTPEELKKLEDEHKKAMEAMAAFNKEARELSKTISGITGK